MQRLIFPRITRLTARPSAATSSGARVTLPTAQSHFDVAARAKDTTSAHTCEDTCNSWLFYQSKRARATRPSAVPNRDLRGEWAPRAPQTRNVTARILYVQRLV